MIEIERKFLVKGEYKSQAHASYRISQGYLCSSSQCTARIRTKNEKGYITIKGKTGQTGISRYEWEKEIPLNEANDLLKLCQLPLIQKTRYEILYKGHTFEVDEFYGENEGLVMAEIELIAENEKFEKPDWLGEEVTADKRYYNSYLSKNPYKNW